MIRALAVFSSLLALLSLTAVSTTSHAAGPVTLPPEIANATIHGTEYGPVTLQDGTWEGEPWVEGGAARPRVGLARDFLRVGDVDGDGTDEAVVIVWHNSGGSGTFNYVALMDPESGHMRNSAITTLGDRVKVLDGRVGPGQIELDVIEHDEDDPACCPTRHATRHYDENLQPIEIP